jgi:uncharacterized membrane protein
VVVGVMVFFCCAGLLFGFWLLVFGSWFLALGFWLVFLGIHAFFLARPARCVPRAAPLLKNGLSTYF